MEKKDDEIKILEDAYATAGAAEEAALDAQHTAAALRSAANAMKAVLDAESYTDQKESACELETFEDTIRRAAEVLVEAKQMTRTLTAQAKTAQYQSSHAAQLAAKAAEETAAVLDHRREMLELAVADQQDRAERLASVVNDSIRFTQETITQRKMRENDGTMVTVVCITYNHEEFIAQALDSFLMQKTNFKFKVFVGEDCGSDHTAEIVREYAQKYPDIIFPFIREKNMGAQRNLIDLCQRASSPYIAFCEGDDYWIDEYKLQKQFDYMEAHPSIRICATQTEIAAPEDWHLRSWYRPTAEGKLLIPDSVPGFSCKETYSSAYIINLNVAHTSTHFYRWNYDLIIPDWYYEGIIGDTPLLLLQLGTGALGHLRCITSVYRINDGSVWFDTNREANFLRTRKNYVRYLSGLAIYARENFKGYPIVALENRIKLETANYLEILIKNGDTDSIAEFFAKYPEAGRISLNAYLHFYRDQRVLTATYTWPGYQLAVRNKYFRRTMKPVVMTVLKLKTYKDKLKKKWKRPVIFDKFKNLLSWFLYWKQTFVKKDTSLWVFSGFRKTNYMDNSKYLYEYVLENHPEINAVWITKSDSVYHQLEVEGKPVLKMHTAKCRKTVARAAIAVTDHFKMSDYDAFSGLNDRIKFVQLWHGVGLKSIGDLKNTNVVGVQFCCDILPCAGDSWSVRFWKKLKYIRHAYYRELFEKYFLLVCPGYERIEQIAKPWHIPAENCFLSGHPRNILLHRTEKDDIVAQILYAPTYRWNADKEKELVNQIVDAAEDIQDYMELVNGELTVRLHPHTWRNYSSVLQQMAGEYDRIKIDTEKDVYPSLGKYSVLISDYSSIAYDFILLDRPVIFFNYDFEEFLENECALNYDYDEYSPGVKTKTWQETLEAVGSYLSDPEKDGPWRRKVRDEFYDMSVNDENNSERIVQEIKRRLSLEDKRTVK